MAASLTLLSATKYALTYLWSTDAAGSQTASRTKAQMLADAIIASGNGGPSPMIAFLTPKTAAAGWADMASGNPASLYTRVQDSTNGICAQAAFGTVPGEQLNITGSVGGGAISAGDNIVVEFRLHHTYDR